MSRSIDLFIECPKPIDEVASELARTTRMTLTPGTLPATWSLEEDGVHAELRAHPYIDDGDLVLERYQYVLSCRVSDGRRLTDSPEANLLRMVSEALHKEGIGSLIVHDLQYRDRVVSRATGEDPAEPSQPAEAS